MRGRRSGRPSGVSDTSVDRGVGRKQPCSWSTSHCSGDEGLVLSVQTFQLSSFLSQKAILTKMCWHAPSGRSWKTAQVQVDESAPMCTCGRSDS